MQRIQCIGENSYDRMHRKQCMKYDAWNIVTLEYDACCKLHPIKLKEYIEWNTLH